MQENLTSNPLIQSVSDSATAPTVVPANDRQPKTNSFIVILLSILLFISVSIAGFFAFQTQKLVKELTMLKTAEKVVAMVTSEPIVEPTATNSASTTADPTSNWKIYANTDFSYKYPTDWKEGQGGQTIVSDVAGANITNFTKDMPMYNECMKLDKTDKVDNKMVKYYSYIYSGEMCSNKNDIGNYQVWITKIDSDGFQPGIIYFYNTTAFPKSFEIFKQILSTFKFTN